jgi:hypothetical protein
MFPAEIQTEHFPKTSLESTATPTHLVLPLVKTEAGGSIAWEEEAGT